MPDAPNSYVVGQPVQFVATYETSAWLTSALAEGDSYSSLSTSPLPAPVTSGDLLTLTGFAGASQLVTVGSAGALQGAVSIPVVAFTATSPFPSGPPPSGTNISYVVDPTTVTFTYTLSAAGAMSNDYLYVPAGSGIGVVLRASKGVYLFWLDTTGITARGLTYDWPSTGVGFTRDGGKSIILVQPRVTT